MGFPSSGDLSDLGIESESLTSPALVDGFFITSATKLLSGPTHDHDLQQ